MSWMTIAKKEYLENVRNAWVIAVSTVFFALTLLASYFGSLAAGNFGAQPGFAHIVPTLSAMDTVSGFLLPILAITLGFGTISGERESGSLALLVAQPVRRLDVVLGKWAGLFGVLATATLAGFGLGGLLVLARTGASGADLYALSLFLLVTLVWGAAWTSITLFLSAWFQRRGTTIAAAISAWFLSTAFVWNILCLLVVSVLFGDSLLAQARAGTPLPGALIVTQWLNPTAAYEGLLATTLEGYSTLVSTIARAAGLATFTAPGFVVALAAWIALPLYGAYALFEKRDV